MTETYSLSVTAMDADNTRYTPALLIIGDSAGRAGGQQAAMQSGQQVLCKLPDGSQAWMTIDPVRSVAGGSLVMLAV